MVKVPAPSSGGCRFDPGSKAAYSETVGLAVRLFMIDCIPNPDLPGGTQPLPLGRDLSSHVVLIGLAG